MGNVDLGTVLVTGGASGLGAAVAQAVALAGGTPVVLDRVAPAFDIDHEVVDLIDRVATEAAVARVLSRHPDLRGVVTAAGTDACGRLEDVPADDWERVVTVNLLGTVSVVRAALPALDANGGRVVTVASMLGLRALSDATAYCASKFGVVGFTRALAAKTAGRIGVTLLIPGGMHTAFFDSREDRYKPPADAKLNQRRTSRVPFCSRSASRPAASCGNWSWPRRSKARGPNAPRCAVRRAMMEQPRDVGSRPCRATRTTGSLTTTRRSSTATGTITSPTTSGR